MGLPAWLQPLPDAAQQRRLDSWAIEQHGIPAETLMERAGAGLARVCAELVPEGRFAIVCGKGNNGGDGRVAARVLREMGREASVIDVDGDVAELSPAALAGAAGIVDALLGTGFSGAPREPVSGAIAAINAARAGAAGVTVIACDVPSGVDGSTGEISGEAVRADATVTFHAAKPGLWIAPGKRHAGHVHVIDIGIPAQDQPVEPMIGLIDADVCELIPRRDAASNKFSVGSVLVVGGSRGLTGAPVLASMAAARAGAGYVTVATPASVAPAIAAKLLEVMVVELPDDRETGLRRGSSRMAVERASRSDALVLGPGIGRLPAAMKFARDVCDSRQAAARARRRRPQRARRGGRARTAGEAGGADGADAACRRARTPARAAERRDRRASPGARAAPQPHARRRVVVLKGDDTLVADPDGRVARQPRGRAGARDRRHRGRARRRDRGVPGEGP